VTGEREHGALGIGQLRGNRQTIARNCTSCAGRAPGDRTQRGLHSAACWPRRDEGDGTAAHLFNKAGETSCLRFRAAGSLSAQFFCEQAANANANEPVGQQIALKPFHITCARTGESATAVRVIQLSWETTERRRSWCFDIRGKPLPAAERLRLSGWNAGDAEEKVEHEQRREDGQIAIGEASAKSA